MKCLGEFLPLSPATLHILFPLPGKTCTATESCRKWSASRKAATSLAPGTLYDNLQKLIDRGLVREVGQRTGEERRRYYRLSTLGLSSCRLEPIGLEGVVREAKLRMQQRRPKEA